MTTISDPELTIEYFADTDTLVLTTEEPGGNGETVGKNLVAWTNAEGDVIGITLEHAAKLLRSYLFPEGQAEGADEENLGRPTLK